MGDGPITKREFGGTYRKAVGRKNASWWFMAVGFRDLATIPIVTRSLTVLLTQQARESPAQPGGPVLRGRGGRFLHV